MAISTKAIDFLSKWEGGYQLKCYLDIGNRATISVGHLVLPPDPWHVGDVISLDQAKAIFINDLKKTESIIDKFVKIPLNENQRGAVASLVFNCGSGPLAGTVGKLLNSGDYTGASNAFIAWCKYTKNGQLLTSVGLLNRRKSEQVFFNTPISNTSTELSQNDIDHIQANITMGLNLSISEMFDESSSDESTV